MLEAMRPLPAHVVSGTGDVLAWNPGGLRLLAGMEDWPARQRNIARYVFLLPPLPPPPPATSSTTGATRSAAA